MDEIRIPIKPIQLTAGTVTEIVFLDPDRPHSKPDERGCPDCGMDGLYDSGCEAPDCTGYGCADCGDGCDIDFADSDTSRCARALADAQDGEAAR